MFTLYFYPVLALISVENDTLKVITFVIPSITFEHRRRTGLVVRASDSGSGDPGSILGLVGVLFP